MNYPGGEGGGRRYPLPTPHFSCLGKTRPLMLRYLPGSLHSGRSQHLPGPTQVALAPAMESDPAGKQSLFVLSGCDLGHPETSPRSLSRASVCDQGPPDDPYWPWVRLDQPSLPGHSLCKIPILLSATGPGNSLTKGPESPDGASPLSPQLLTWATSILTAPTKLTSSWATGKGEEEEDLSFSL